MVPPAPAPGRRTPAPREVGFYKASSTAGLDARCPTERASGTRKLGRLTPRAAPDGLALGHVPLTTKP
jgi:hypothetical protein